ncbi:hypothetical protein [Micromonospora ureilytica]|uniref:hypothetical protein n=1 Tax=Micromonospora ureilytica TaxID=709868 RepID=UPI0040394718
MKRMMQPSRVLGPILALLLAGWLVAASPAQAASSSAAPPISCSYYLYAPGVGDSCFQPDGDVTWLDDIDDDGWNPEVMLEASYPAEGNSYKTRFCTHDPDSRWQSCNFDHRETHCVRWWIYERNASSPNLTRLAKGPTPWLGADDGRPGNCIIE